MMARKRKDHGVENPEKGKKAKREPAPLEKVVVDDSLPIHQFQVVRGEYYSFTRKPSLTFNNTKISVNAVCLEYFPHVEHIQFIIDPVNKKLGIQPCDEYDKNALKWRNAKDGKNNPRQITAAPFNAMLMNLMAWSPDYRYKLIGQFTCCKGEYLFLFDLTAVMSYQRPPPNDENPQSARLPRFPKEWKNQFGLTVEEHGKRIQKFTFKNYVVFGAEEGFQPELPLS